jgi:hypothetical protein
MLIGRCVVSAERTRFLHSPTTVVRFVQQASLRASVMFSILSTGARLARCDAIAASVADSRVSRRALEPTGRGTPLLFPGTYQSSLGPRSPSPSAWNSSPERARPAAVARAAATPLQKAACCLPHL